MFLDRSHISYKLVLVPLFTLLVLIFSILISSFFLNSTLSQLILHVLDYLSSVSNTSFTLLQCLLFISIILVFFQVRSSCLPPCTSFFTSYVIRRHFVPFLFVYFTITIILPLLIGFPLVNFLFVFFSLCLIPIIYWYLLDLINPNNLISLILMSGIKAVESSVNNPRTNQLVINKHLIVETVTLLSDIVTYSMSPQSINRSFITSSIDALCLFSCWAGLYKALLPKEFFELPSFSRSSVDMMSLSIDIIADLTEKNLWIEFMILRHFQFLSGVTNTSLSSSLLILAQLSRATRKIALGALYRKDLVVYDLCVRFFNTFIRTCINNQDLRALSNVLFELRSLGSKSLLISSRLQHQLTVKPFIGDESELIRPEDIDKRVLLMGKFLRYYSIVCLEDGFGVASEVIAHDTQDLVETAYRLRRSNHDDLLAILLTIDDVAEWRQQTTTLRGIRRAQIKLAVTYLVHGHLRFAKLIVADMKEEPHERLISIYQELMAIDSKDAFEISDRGSDNNYLTPQQKEKLPLFFSFFKGLDISSGGNEEQEVDLEKEIKGLRVQARTINKGCESLDIPNVVS
ncbi:hypothetical protein P9112_004335 [Eukaryota sp. TZLM1-RC]